MAVEAVNKLIKREHRVIGIGSGSTIVFAVERLKERMVEEGLDFVCIPSSYQAKSLIIGQGLPLGDLDIYSEIDITIDGADEIVLDRNCLIKGGGGALLREKIIAACAKRFVVIADYRKLSDSVGKMVLLLNEL